MATLAPLGLHQTKQFMRTFLLLKLLSKSMLESMDTAFQSVLQGIREPIILAARWKVPR